MDYTTRSKFLSFGLRHDPANVGLKLDENGWASTESVLTALTANNLPLDIEGLKELVESNSKKRFEFTSDGLSIRACQGHSIAVDLGLKKVRPPAVLYHGTSDKSITSIQKAIDGGIKKMNRDHIHLSADEATAYMVGRRHGAPVIIVVHSQAMHNDGYDFYMSTNGVWLTDQTITSSYFIKTIYKK